MTWRPIARQKRGMHFPSSTQVVAGFAAVLTLQAAGSEPSFTKKQLSNQFWAEGANAGDFNHDGKPDIVSGPYWWAGPEFKERHQYAPDVESFKVTGADGTEETIPGF